MKQCPRTLALPLVAVILALLSVAGCQTKAVPAAPSASPEPSAALAATPASPPETVAVAGSPGSSASEPPPLPEPSAVIPDADGFWPAPESRSPEISVSVLVGNKEHVRSWKVEIATVPGAVVKTFAGGPNDLPETLTWAGMGNDGKLAREGLHTARLSADYEGGLAAISLMSKPFALSLSAPEPVLFATPSRLESGPKGLKEAVTFEVTAQAALAGLDSWRLDIVGPDGRIFRSFEGAWPSTGSPAAISWNGRSDSGMAVEAGRRYSAILSVRDIYGHAASTQAGLAVADLPFATERSSVRPWTTGFSPNGDKVMDSMDFSLGFGQRSAIRSWRLEISHAERGIVRGFHGAAPDLPASVSWDGKNSFGVSAPEGRYVATLSIDYGSTFSPAVARSSPFILDLTPPVLRLSSSPALFAPDGSGGADTKLSVDARLSIQLDASSKLARLTDWSVEILDPGRQLFARFGGAWPATVISWDGLGADGSLVESAETYRMVARVRDEFGNSGQAEGNVETDILVIKEGNRYRIDVASIVFKGYTSDFEDLVADQVDRNRLTLDRLAAKFTRFPDYRIRLVGHAVMINWDDPNRGKPEQEKILVPLSRSRAAAIAKALAQRGIASSRMVVEGVGASKPLVPDSDLVNRWKNRRVEFYLEK